MLSYHKFSCYLDFYFFYAEKSGLSTEPEKEVHVKIGHSFSLKELLKHSSADNEVIMKVDE